MTSQNHGASTSHDSVSEVLAAAAKIVAEFGAHDAQGLFRGLYFPNATYIVLYPRRAVQSTRAAYRGALGEMGVRRRFQSSRMASTDQLVQLIGDDAAVFSRYVASRRFGSLATVSTVLKRETIVLH
jgi:hypothetical protein